MEIAARLDEISRPAWIGLMVLGFIVFWPVGLAILAYLIWSRRMGCGPRGWKREWKQEFKRRWREDPMGQMQNTADRWFGGHRRQESSGNRAFDEYRAETLRRLEEEQKEFRAFLDRLRFAKDKAEFDEFLAERRRQPPQAPEPQPET